ncbi:Stk1 family PASTA domain-containing Ser/Thr kinase [Planococcus lenghuensis]|uniref:Serine/threonine-protein kinase PrkC n=1 Tax=Planococcus lenghuensis TaxID=2213202 RepID=A0A1Q2L068_9BACL|nr:Stk1 family PASTA domain-containing Ser/Thr kinase [Planococcus lenghuensis]AQQ53764.1 serine/threonine protein kinase [Planococcus lenghuensis]
MLIGKRLNGRYRIEKAIGGGGMSNVYLGHDIILDRDVAIKILRYDFSNEEELRWRFQREALSASSLTHTNIVNIFDVGEEGDIHFLVMEYVTGQTLKDYIVQQAPIAPEKAVDIMLQLTSALAHAHQNQIVHRDIKPQNILIDRNGRVKVTDFGIAMALTATSYTQTNSVLGTVHYLSPEQARGGTATKKSDIYSLGIVMFELLTGQLPFSGESAVSIALKHLQSDIPSLRSIVPDMPQSLENIVLKATAKDLQYRYGSVEAMEEDLTEALEESRRNEPKFIIPDDSDATRAMPAIRNTSTFVNADETIVLKPTPPAPEEAPPVKKRKKWPWILAGIPVAVLLLGLFLALGFPRLFEEPRIQVPDVTGLEAAAAAEELEAAGFTAGPERQQTSEEVEEGMVIRTVPEAGKERVQETEVELVVSAGRERVEFEDYTGERFEQAAELLRNLGFENVALREEFSAESEGIILNQNIAAGSDVVPGETSVMFTVSKGQDLREVTDLVGFTEEEINDYARSSGFNIRIIGQEYSDSVEPGLVLEQYPAAGTALEAGSMIEVVLSRGPEAAPLKTFIQTVMIPYGEALAPEEPAEGETPETVPQTVQIFIQDRNQTMDAPAEEFTITDDASRRIELEIEEGQIGMYRILRDGEVLVEESIPYAEAE